VVRHLTFVAAVAEIVAHVLRPLIGLGEQHAIGVAAGDVTADDADDLVRLAQILVDGAFALAEVWHGIQAEAIDPEAQPEVHDAQHGAQHLRIVEIQVRLVTEEAVPVVSACFGVPGPVGRLGVAEDDARARVALWRVAPDVVVALRRAGRCAARRLEPGVGVGGMVEHELGDHAQVAAVRLADERPELRARAVLRMDVVIVGDVVAIVPPWGGVEGQQPDGVDAEVLDVLELARQPEEIADAIIVGVEERAYVHLVDDRVLEPQRVAA